jgi:hypothetical protein
MPKKLDILQIEKSPVSVHYQYLAAQAVVDKALSSPQDPSFSLCGPMEDWERPNPNEALPHWNLWGDAGLITRLHIYSPYPKNPA